MGYIAKQERYEKMIYRPCGKSGLKLPLLSLGLWHNFGTEADYDNMKDICFTAFDEGITHFDLANNYGPLPGSAESNFGRILREEMSAYRDEMIICTKAGYLMWDGPYGDGGSKKYLISSLDQSLKRMGLEYVDIFYHHRPDTETPLEETMNTLAQIVRSGKALYVGLSNYDGTRMLEASKILEELRCPFVINQNRYSMLDKTILNNGLHEQAKQQGKGIITYSPLAQGLLSDKYLAEIPEDSRMKTDGRFLNENSISDQLRSKLALLNDIAKERGQTLAQMALAYIAYDENITSVLIGASKAIQIKENVSALDNIHFSEDEIKSIESILLQEG